MRDRTVVGESGTQVRRQRHDRAGLGPGPRQTRSARAASSAIKQTDATSSSTRSPVESPTTPTSSTASTSSDPRTSQEERPVHEVRHLLRAPAPAPVDRGLRAELIQNALDQVELADKLGIQYVWEVEHHFLEEYSHSSAPEIFLAACSQRTKNIRLGHGIIQTAPRLQPPGPHRRARRHARPRVERSGRLRLGRVVERGRARWLPHRPDARSARCGSRASRSRSGA